MRRDAISSTRSLNDSLRLTVGFCATFIEGSADKVCHVASLGNLYIFFLEPSRSA